MKLMPINFSKNSLGPLLRRFISLNLLIICLPVFANEELTNKNTETRVEVLRTELVNLVEYSNRGLSSQVLLEKMAEARNQYPARMTMNELNSVADVITTLYRAQGFKFHTVYLPPQIPKDGIVHFKTVEALLGDIHIIGKDIDNDAINAVFEPFLNKPLYQPDIDYAVMALKKQRGIEAVAYYSRGSRAGEIRLNIKVNQQRWAGYAQIDNYGSQSTGETRLTTGIEWLSPSGRLDQLSIGIMAANGDPNTNLFGYLNYSAPLWNLDNQLSLNLSNNQFSIGEDFSNLELDGDARIAQLRLDHQLTRTWSSQQQLGFIVAYKSTDYDSAFNDPTLERDESSESLALEWSLNTQNNSTNVHQQWLLGITGGRFETDGITDDKDDFTKVNAATNFRHYLGTGESRWSNIANLSLKAQHSIDPLPSFEKFLLTGAYGVRSFKPGFFAGDRGALLSLDWYFPQLLNMNKKTQLSMTPLLFVDVAYGEKLTLASTVFDRSTISGAGLGLEVTLGRSWSARLFSSKEISQETDSGQALESMDLFFQINYRTH